MAAASGKARRPYGTAGGRFCAIRLAVSAGVRGVALGVAHNVAVTVENIKFHFVTLNKIFTAARRSFSSAVLSQA